MTVDTPFRRIAHEEIHSLEIQRSGTSFLRHLTVHFSAS